MTSAENGVVKTPPLISLLQEKPFLDDNDLFLIEDSHSAFFQKRVKRLAVNGGAWNIEDEVHVKMSLPATHTHTDTDPASLNTAIQALPDGAVLEVNSQAVYNPITIPANKSLIIRGKMGTDIRITGKGCVRLANGARDTLVANVLMTDSSSDNPNYYGAGITFETHQTKVSNITFFACCIDNVTQGSGVMLSYHWSVDGDTYDTPNTLAECSERVSFVWCSFYKANKDNTEGAALALRGIIRPNVTKCFFKDQALSMRQMQLQNCVQCGIYNNNIRNTATAGTNSEGIKLDDLGGCSYRSSGEFFQNTIKNAIEGIDIDDNADAILVANICFNCTEEGISIDDSATAVIENNLCYNCRYDAGSAGIRVEAGAVVTMDGNNCFNNITNYDILNGYTLPGSNVSSLVDVVLKDSAENIPYAGSIAGAYQVKQALEVVNDRPYTDVTTTSATLAVSTLHGANNAALVTLTLPTTATKGQRIAVVGVAAGGWTIAQNASQSIRQGATVSTVGTGGSVSGDQGESVEIVCVDSGNTWVVTYSSGTLTFV